MYPNAHYGTVHYNQDMEAIKVTMNEWMGKEDVISSVAQSCPTLCNPMVCRTQGFPVHHQLLEHTQTHVHLVSGATQSSHLLSIPYPPACNLSQHQGLFQWVSSLHQVGKVLELQHKPFQWIFRTFWVCGPLCVNCHKWVDIFILFLVIFYSSNIVDIRARLVNNKV